LAKRRMVREKVKETQTGKRTAAQSRRSALLSAETLADRDLSGRQRRRTMCLRSLDLREDNSPATKLVPRTKTLTDYI